MSAERAYGRVMSPEQVAEATAAVVQLMPEEWRDSPGIPALSELPGRADCAAVLKELTRGIPLHMLLDRGKDSVHFKHDRSMLTAANFFGSTPTDIKVFVSHRWAADPVMTAQALLMSYFIRYYFVLFNRMEDDPFIGRFILNVFPCQRLRRCIVPGIFPTSVFAILLCPIILAAPVFGALIAFGAYLSVQFFDHNSILARLLFCKKAWMPHDIWFDKCSVHQTEPCLNQAGIALFPYYLQKASELWIFFTPEYLTRVWCVYELARWLSTKPKAPIFLVPLDLSSRLYKLALRVFPLFVLGCITFGIAFLFAIVFLHRLIFLTPPAQSAELYEFAWMGGFMVWLLSIPFFLLTGAVILWPMRQGRLLVAKQLEAFDVNDCSAAFVKDKDFVLGLVAQWFRKDGEEDTESIALARFNKLVRTQVATRLRRMLLMGELQVASFFVVFPIMFLSISATFVAMLLDELRPLIWPSAHADLSRFVTTDECVLSHCCEIVAGTQSSRLFEVLNVNQTNWCEASVNLTLCQNASGGSHPSSSDQCVGFWDVNSRNNCFFGISACWLVALAFALHARWLGAKLAGEKCCK